MRNNNNNNKFFFFFLFFSFNMKKFSKRLIFHQSFFFLKKIHQSFFFLKKKRFSDFGEGNGARGEQNIAVF